MSGETRRQESGWTTDTLKDHIDQQLEANRNLSDERDRLYKERDDSRRTAVDAALTAVKEQTAAAFTSSEKAIVKAEEAQKAYNASHNDLARKMDEQNKATMPRAETEARFRSMEEKIGEIREAMSTASGIGHGGKAMWGYVAGGAGFLLTLMSIAGLLYAAWKR